MIAASLGLSASPPIPKPRIEMPALRSLAITPNTRPAQQLPDVLFALESEAVRDLAARLRQARPYVSFSFSICFL